jgi:hypothetical protein
MANGDAGEGVAVEQAPNEPPPHARRHWLRRSLAVLGLLAGGVAANAVWEMIRPGVWHGRDLLLNLVSWGIESQKNAVFADVARGYHEESSLALLIALLLTLFTVAVAIAMAMWVIGSELWADVDPHDLGRLPFFVGWVARGTRRLRRRILRIAAAVALVYGGFFLALILRQTYVNAAIASYVQLRSSVAPYVTHDELLRFDSRFAQMQTEDDYDRLIADLADRAKKNGLVVPPR